MKYRTPYLLILLGVFFCESVRGQAVPSELESVDYLVTFGKGGETKWGDDDFSQVFFFSVPNELKSSFYIRVFDPDCGGGIDEDNKGFNTKTKFSVYGGAGAHSNPDSKNVDPKGNYKAGTLLSTKTFGVSPAYDGKWYSFGPFHAEQGEDLQGTNSKVFKLIADGVVGDDGNLYKYFLSSKADANVSVTGGNAFTYEYAVRLRSRKGAVTHLYPHIDKTVAAVIQHNFDGDNDVDILVYSVAKNRHVGKVSNENIWVQSRHNVVPQERNTSYDLQIVKKSSFDNDIVIYVTNQYNEPIPFYSVPIGGPPKYKYKVKLNYK